jgi:hypothetical protein
MLGEGFRGGSPIFGGRVFKGLCAYIFIKIKVKIRIKIKIVGLLRGTFGGMLSSFFAAFLGRLYRGSPIFEGRV